MVLFRSEERSEEGYTPGLKFFPSRSSSDSAILLNATYNNYTITNHYQSKPQLDENKRLKKDKEELDSAYIMLDKKYKAAKKLLNRTMPLLSFINLETLDPLIREDVLEMRQKWATIEIHKNKRKKEWHDETGVRNDSKKHKTTVK